MSTRRVIYALRDTEHRGVLVKKGGALGEDERPWPEPDNVTWGIRYVLERDVDDATLAAERSANLISSGRGGVINRPGPTRGTTPAVSAAKQRKVLEPVKAGDAGFALPLPADYNDEDDVRRYRKEMADLKAQVDAENALREKGGAAQA